MTICWKVLFLVKWTLMSSTYPPIFEENSANIKFFQISGSVMLYISTSKLVLRTPFVLVDIMFLMLKQLFLSFSVAKKNFFLQYMLKNIF